MSVVAPGSVGQPRLASLLGRRRQTWSGDGRSHIEHREVPCALLPAFDREVLAALQDHPGVAWAALQVRPPRIVVAHDALWATTEELVAVVEEVEDRLELSEWFRRDRPSHPADVEPLVRLLTEIGTDLASFGGAVAGRAAGAGRCPTAADHRRSPAGWACVARQRRVRRCPGRHRADPRRERRRRLPPAGPDRLDARHRRCRHRRDHRRGRTLGGAGRPRPWVPYRGASRGHGHARADRGRPPGCEGR